MPTELFSDYIELGYISGCHGIQGWIKAFSDTDPRDNIFQYKSWWLSDQSNSLPQEYKLRKGQASGRRLIAQLENINSRDQAENLVGYRIYIPKTDLPDLTNGDYYWRDLIGLTVINTKEKKLGTVDELLESAAHDILVVIGPNKQRILIPYTVGTHIIQVDLNQQRITVDWEDENP